jgi:hypothetical protein
VHRRVPPYCPGGETRSWRLRLRNCVESRSQSHSCERVTKPTCRTNTDHSGSNLIEESWEAAWEIGDFTGARVRFKSCMSKTLRLGTRIR